MAKVAHNFLANMAGMAWGTAIGLVAVPVYLRLIGAEGYGLIGFYTVLSSLLSIMDAGFSAAAGRELARSEGGAPEARAQAAETVRSLERGFLLAAILLGGLVVAVAPAIAARWLNVHELAADSATRAIRLMGVAFILQFPLALYNGCLLGMQRHALMNGVASAIGTARAVGAIVILSFFSRTVEAFFAWQIVVTLANFVVTRGIVFRLLPSPRGRVAFDLGRVRAVGRFAMGIGAINMLGLAISQLDKALLSFILPLREFGYYMLAWTLASLIYRLSGPLFNSVLPRMMQLEALGDRNSTRSLFQRSGQLMAVLVVPFAIFLAIYSEEVVWLWTSSAEAAAMDRWALCFLALGTMVNTLMQVPFAAQVAVGRLRPLLIVDLAALIVQVPLLFVLATRAGIAGAAAAWAILNIGIFGAIIAVTRTHMDGRQVLEWIVRSVAIPIGIAAAFFASAHTIFPERGLGRAMLFVTLALSGTACELLVAWAVPFVRNRLFSAARSVFSRARR